MNQDPSPLCAKLLAPPYFPLCAKLKAVCNLSRDMSRRHKRRIKTEEKAKVVAAVWGTALIQFLAALDTVFSTRMILKKKINNRIKAFLAD